MKQWNWKYFVLLLVAIPIVNQLAGYMGRSAADQVNQQEAAARKSQVSQDIQVLVSSQDAEGVTQNNLGPEFLKAMENYTVERVKINANKFRASKGLPAVDFDIQSQSLYVEAGQLKLMVIRLHSPSDSVSQAFVSGIVGSELKRVTCIWQSPETVPISYGPCAAKIQEVLGVKIGA